MTRYRERQNTTTRTLTTFLRPYSFTMDLPLEGDAGLTFLEETVQEEQGRPDTVLDGGVALSHLVDRPSDSFDLLHPQTGNPTGTMTYAELRLALESLYVHLANERDGT